MRASSFACAIVFSSRVVGYYVFYSNGRVGLCQVVVCCVFVVRFGLLLGVCGRGFGVLAAVLVVLLGIVVEDRGVRTLNVFSENVA